MVVICFALIASLILDIAACSVMGLGWWAGVELLIALLIALPLAAAIGASLSRKIRPRLPARTPPGRHSR